ncbi:MAG TPA: substrate-binding domain-containing protein [Ornithinibacter sp.]|nr:substrate-binding domain-containing protein [Ornithinibacter sp.]
MRRPKGRLTAGILVLAVLLGFVAWRGWVGWSGTGPAVPFASWCEDTPTVTVTTTAAMAPVVRTVTEAAEDTCATWTVTAESPTATAQRYEGDGGRAPQVWIPDSPLLAQQVASRSAGRAAVRPPVAATPVVLAVPDGQQAPDPATWGATVLAESTRLPDPNTSTVGRTALMVGLAEIDSLPADQRSGALAGIGGMLSRVVPEETLLTGHVTGTDPAVFPTTEQQVHEAGVSGLTVVQSTSTTPALEYPLVVSTSAPADAVAALSTAFAADAGQRALRDAGFRTPSNPTPVLAGGPPAGSVAAQATPEQAEAAERMWAAIATPTRLLTVIDTSGSMDQPASSGESRIEVASRAASGAVQLLADHNAVGLWTFSTLQRGERDWTQVQPVSPLGSDDQRAKLAFSLGSLATELGGDTGLYDTLDAAYAAAIDDFDPRANNLIALFTDGVNDDPAGGLDLAELRERLAAAGSADRPVTVLLVGMGGVDAAALAPVAAAIPREGGGGGAVFTIERPEDIADVYVTMLLRRLPGAS